MKRPIAVLISFLLVAVGIVFIAADQFYWSRVVLPERNAIGAASPVPSGKLDPGNEGRLVILTGPLGGAEILADPEFKVETNALRLRRRVWMYQWEDVGPRSKSAYSVEDPNGQKTTLLKTATRQWVTVWSEKILRPQFGQNASASIPVPRTGVNVKIAGTGHDNPQEMGVPSRGIDANHVTLGAFSLAPELVKQIDNFVAIPTTTGNLTHGNSMIFGDSIYIGSNPNEPAIGDLRIRFEFAPPATATVVAQQSGSNLVPYSVNQSAKIATLRMGCATAAQIADAYGKTESEQRLIVRVAGGVFIVLGILIMRPRHR